MKPAPARSGRHSETAAALWRLSPAPRIVVSATVLISTATAILAAIYALTEATAEPLGRGAGGQPVLTGALKLAARMAGIPIPPFPTVTGKDTFADADAIAAEALVVAEHQGNRPWSNFGARLRPRTST